MALPTDAAARKALPLASGCLDYFPAALATVAGLSQVGNEQHNPGQELFWDRSKSGDEGDALVRHFLERGTVDTDGIRHSAKVAWRALALLQKELEAEEGAPLARGAMVEPVMVDGVLVAGPIPRLAPYGRGIAYDAHPGAHGASGGFCNPGFDYVAAAKGANPVRQDTGD